MENNINELKKQRDRSRNFKYYIINNHYYIITFWDM